MLFVCSSSCFRMKTSTIAGHFVSFHREEGKNGQEIAGERKEIIEEDV